MPQYSYAVWTDAVEGREDEYNAWYNDIHLPEVLDVPGFIAAKRFRVLPAPDRPASHRYLAIYEIESDDPEATLVTLTKASETMNMSGALELTTVVTHLVEPIAELRR